MANSNATTTGIAIFDNLFTGMFADILMAIAILLIGFIIGRIVGKLVKRGLNEFKIDQILRKNIGLKISLENIISSFLTYSILLIAIILALNQVGVTAFILNILGTAVILLITTSIILALKDLVPNFFAGLKISQKEMVKKGDVISFDKIKAKVKEVTLTETRLESKSGDIIFIPNSLLLKKILKRPKRKKKKS